jgi:dsRNA-specific ribonuclease
MDYKKVISRIFRYVRLNQTHFNYFVNHPLFAQAFVHKSYNDKNNYDYLEIRGDCAVNLAINQYILYRFPKLKSSKWLTKLTHNMRGTLYLSELAKKYEFDKYVKYDKTQKIYLEELYEDVFESFFGTIIIISEKFGKGYGYNLVYNIISKMFDKFIIQLNIDDLFDRKSRVKEIYDLMKWNFNDKTLREEYRGDGKYNVKMIAYPRNDKTNDKQNQKQYSAFSYKSYDDANNFLYRNMLADFQNYGIVEQIANPYGMPENILDSVVDIQFTQDFKNKILKIMKLSRLNEEYIQKYSQDLYLAEFIKCFIDSSFSSETNMELYLYEGIPAVDYIVIDYITSKIKSTKEGLFTTVRHNIIGRSGLIQRIFNDMEFEKYIKYGPDLEELFEKVPDKHSHVRYQRLIGNVIKSIIGCLIHIFDKHEYRGVGYALAYNFLSVYLDTININDYTETDYKTKLKEKYDRDYSLGKFKDSIVHRYDEETRLHHIDIQVRGKIIARSSDKLKDIAINKASKIAFEKLSK